MNCIIILEDPNDKNIVWIAAVNHKQSGSVIERFEYNIQLQKLTHLKTISDQELLPNPNDVAPVGKVNFKIFNVKISFYATNDFGSTEYFEKKLEGYTRRKWSSVVFSDETGKLKKAAVDLVYANGIKTSTDGETVYVNSCTGKRTHVFVRKSNNELQQTDVIPVPVLADNLAVSPEGDVYVTGPQQAFKWLSFADDAKAACPWSTVRISINTNQDRFYGKKVIGKANKKVTSLIN